MTFDREIIINSHNNQIELQNATYGQSAYLNQDSPQQLILSLSKGYFIKPGDRILVPSTFWNTKNCVQTKNITSIVLSAENFTDFYPLPQIVGDFRVSYCQPSYLDASKSTSGGLSTISGMQWYYMNST